VHICDRTLIMFLGSAAARVLRYVPGAWQPGDDINSPAPKVDAVVDLILQHAQERPEESLGLMTMRIRHWDRVEERLRQHPRDDPELASTRNSSSIISTPSRICSWTRNSVACPGDAGFGQRGADRGCRLRGADAQGVGVRAGLLADLLRVNCVRAPPSTPGWC
jgi:hypothetical protein